VARVVEQELVPSLCIQKEVLNLSLDFGLVSIEDRAHIGGLMETDGGI
jgi:hypothetical protein